MNIIKKEQSNWLDPFDVMSDLHDEFNRFYSGSLRKLRDRDLPGFFTPDIELSEDQENYQVKVEIPGMKKEDIEVNLTGSTLTLKGEKKEEKEMKDKKFYHTERRYGSFQRVVEFPTEVKSDLVKATYKEGLLELVIPKAESAKPKQIKVEIK